MRSRTGLPMMLFFFRRRIILPGVVRLFISYVTWILFNKFIFKVTVSLPPNTIVQYKYIRIDNGEVTWESDPNNQFTTPASGDVTEQDTWR